MNQIRSFIQDSSPTTKYATNMLYIALSCLISSHTTDFLHIPFTLFFYFVNFGSFHTKLYFLLLLFNLSVIMVFKKTKLRTYFLLIINLLTFGIVKHFSKEINLDVKSKNNVSIQFMLLVPKMFYISKEVVDLQYLFFLPSIMAGPVIPLYDFIERGPCKIHFKKILYCFFYASLIFLLKDKITFEMLSEKKNFFSTFFLLFFYGVGFRSQYYFVWTFSSFCYSICGLEIQNVDPFSFEMSPSMQEVSRKWNMYVSIWLKESIFNPTRKYGNFFAGFLACTVSSMWHGFYWSYFMMFLAFSACVAPLKNMRKYFLLFLGERISKLVEICVTSSLVSFFSVPFYFLDVKMALLVWRRVYFYGLVYLFFSYFVFFAEKIVPKRREKEE